jgi:C_GCAxxG_C_C family probable redox protein
MADYSLLRKRLEMLRGRDWDLPAIEARFRKLAEEGTRKHSLPKADMVARKQEILDRVQRNAEEYCHLTRNCAKGSAAALLEEFGLGNMECVKALVPFPGLALTGGICGPVAGCMIALGLYFSSPDIADFQDKRHYLAAREFLRRFEETFGSLQCPDIQEALLGKYHDPMASPENREAFDNAGARTKCPVAPGLGARIAAEIILESMERE